MNIKFYRCDVCKNILWSMEDSGVNPVCCGQNMTVLHANTQDAAVEKHVPSIERDGTILKVQIGEAVHPMVPEHYIQWIFIVQGSKVQCVKLTPNDTPHAVFITDSTGPITVYEYCNLHGLWKADSL